MWPGGRRDGAVAGFFHPRSEVRTEVLTVLLVAQLVGGFLALLLLAFVEFFR